MESKNVDFINKILNNRATTAQDRERIVSLLLRDRDEKYVTKDELEKLIEGINKRSETVDKQEAIGISKKNVFYHTPLNMVKFLYQFSINDKFKWFTHNPDADLVFDYEKYVNDACSSYKDISKGINPSTWSNVLNFISGSDNPAKDFNNEDIKFRWKDMAKWCFEHKNKHPYYELVDDYKFERYVTLFKNTIEFRTDDSNWSFANRLEDFMYDKAINSQDFSLNFTDDFYSIGNSLRVYVDVRQLFSAIKEIGKWIVANKSKSNIVELSLKEDEDSFVFSIFHKNSFLSIDDEKLKGLSGDFHKVRNMLLNVADWGIDADVRNEAKRIICLDVKTEYKNEVVNNRNQNIIISNNMIENLQSKVGGVKHFIKLYKNK